MFPNMYQLQDNIYNKLHNFSLHMLIFYSNPLLKMFCLVCSYLPPETLSDIAIKTPPPCDFVSLTISGVQTKQVSGKRL